MKDYLKYKAKNTLTNATIAFYSVAKMKIEEKLIEHNKKSKDIADKWKINAEGKY